MSVLVDSYAARLDCGVHSTSQNVQANDQFDISLEFLKAWYPNIVKPGYTVNCNLCFTPIIDTISSDLNPSDYVVCKHLSATIPPTCSCVACPTGTRFQVFAPPPPPWFLQERFGTWEGILSGVIPPGSCEWYTSNNSMEVFIGRALQSGGSAPCAGWNFRVVISGWDGWYCNFTCGLRSGGVAEDSIFFDFYGGAVSKQLPGRIIAADCYAPGEGEVNPPCGGGCDCIWLDQEWKPAVTIQPSSLVDGEWT